MRIVVLAAAVGLSIVGLSVAQNASAGIRRPVNIQAQGLETALQLFSKESGLHVVYVSEDVSSRQTPGASGVLTQDETLSQLLGGTGLTYRYIDDTTVTIKPLSRPGASIAPRRDGSGATPIQQGDQSKPLWEGFRVAQAQTSGNASVSAPQAGRNDRTQPVTLDEVVVTATKLRQPVRTVAG